MTLLSDRNNNEIPISSSTTDMNSLSSENLTSLLRDKRFESTSSSPGASNNVAVNNRLTKSFTTAAIVSKEPFDESRANENVGFYIFFFNFFLLIYLMLFLLN
jgi:hypothetical protein